MEFIEKKQCRKCKEFKELNNFWENKKNADLLQGQCIECFNNFIKGIEEKWVKKCWRCLDLQPLINFKKSKSALDWYYWYCNDCKIIIIKENWLKYKKIKTSNITKKIKCSRRDNPLFK